MSKVTYQTPGTTGSSCTVTHLGPQPEKPASQKTQAERTYQYKGVAIPFLDEYVSAGYKADTYDVFVKARKGEADRLEKSSAARAERELNEAANNALRGVDGRGRALVEPATSYVVLSSPEWWAEEGSFTEDHSFDEGAVEKAAEELAGHLAQKFPQVSIRVAPQAIYPAEKPRNEEVSDYADKSKKNFTPKPLLADKAPHTPRSLT